MEPLLAIDNLEVSFAARPARRGGRLRRLRRFGGRPDRARREDQAGQIERSERVEVVRGVSLAIRRGECLGLVGESGSGKSLTALAALRLEPAAARLGGRVLLAGREPGAPAADLLTLPRAALRRVRGGRIGIVFQEPMTALNPFFTIGFQVAEAVRAHRPARRGEARAEAARLLDRVGLPAAWRRLDAYPHQLSGGERQRVTVAMALAGGPDLLLADEPTTALDVTLQAQILALLEDLRLDLGLGVLLITHDLAVAAATCDRVAVLYAGQVVEEAAVGELFAAPLHPYTRALLATLPHLGRPVPRGQLPVLPGQPAEPAARPTGCAFHPRCGEAMAVCARLDPPEMAVAPPAAGLPAPHPPRRVRCWLHAPIPGGEAGALPDPPDPPAPPDGGVSPAVPALAGAPAPPAGEPG